MRSISLFFIFGMIFPLCSGWAQESNVAAATASLQDVLSTLKQSVEKLSADNDQWGAQDHDLKEQVSRLQMRLGSLEAQGDDLNQAAARLQDKNPRRSQEILSLEEENSRLDDRIVKAENGIKSIQSAPSQATIRPQKEKLRLMKMIDDSEQRQESLYASILEYQKNFPLPAANALARQKLLKDQIKDLEAQIAALPPDKTSASFTLANQWDDTQLQQLEMELKVLEKNYLQLKDLKETMTQKAKSVQMSAGQHAEGEKLKSSMDDLNRQGIGLKADLDTLRAQMIELDKRKSRLEMMIQHSP